MTLQEGRIKAPLGGLRLLDKGKICSEALSCFSKIEQQSSAFAAAIRAKAVLALYNQQERQLAKKGLMKPLLEIEMPMARVLSEMECKGICMDRRVYNLSRLPLVRRQEEVLSGLNAKMESAFKPIVPIHEPFVLELELANM